MPYVSLSDNGAGELQINSGIFGDVFNRLSQVLNFSYTVINPSDGEWGSVKIDGTWSGMVGQLATKTVDFGTQTKLQISCLVDCKTIRTLGYMIHPILLTRNSDTSNFRLQYMDHFWLVPNGMDFHTIRFFGYKEWISDIWNLGY